MKRPAADLEAPGSGLSLFVLFQKNHLRPLGQCILDFAVLFILHSRCMWQWWLIPGIADGLVAVKSHRPGSLGIMTFKTLCIGWQFCDWFLDVTVGSDRSNVDVWYYTNVANRVSTTFLHLAPFNFKMHVRLQVLSGCCGLILAKNRSAQCQCQGQLWSVSAPSCAVLHSMWIHWFSGDVHILLSCIAAFRILQGQQARASFRGAGWLGGAVSILSVELKQS